MMTRTTPSGLALASAAPVREMMLLSVWSAADVSRQHRTELLLGGTGQRRRLVWRQHLMRSMSTGWVDGPAERIELDFEALRSEALCAGQAAFFQSTDRSGTEALQSQMRLRTPTGLDVPMPSLYNDRALRHPITAEELRPGAKGVIIPARNSPFWLHYGVSVGGLAHYGVAMSDYGITSGPLGNFLTTALETGARKPQRPSLIEVDTEPQYSDDEVWYSALDLLCLEGDDLREAPWAERHALLGQLLSEEDIPGLRRVPVLDAAPGAGPYGIAVPDAPYGSGLFRSGK